MNPVVLVTDGEERSSLASVRSLGRAGYRVGVVSKSGRSLAGASRHAAWDRKAPDPLSDPEAYRSFIRHLAVGQSVDVLLPMTEPALMAILPRRDEFDGVAIPFPEYGTFRAITDKSRVASVARDIGLSAPRQEVVNHANPTGSDDLPSLDFPLVLKPARSVGESGKVRRKVTVVHVVDPDSYWEALERLPPQAFPLLVQEKIEGVGAGVFLLLSGEEVLARFAHRRIREKPPSGGVSVCRESVRADPDLVEASRGLLTEFGWDGVAMVEYRIEEKSRKAYVMEVNPRLWGSLQLAIDAGVDFPRLLVDAALGREVEPVLDYEVGVRTRWWWGEVDHLILRVKAAADSGGKAAALRELGPAARDLVTGWGSGCKAEVWSADDRRPFARETLNWLRRR